MSVMRSPAVGSNGCHDRCADGEGRGQRLTPLRAVDEGNRFAATGGEEGLELVLQRLPTLHGEVVRQDGALAVRRAHELVALDLLLLVVERVVTTGQESAQFTHPLRRDPRGGEVGDAAG